ncbi:xanthine dehydrogenase small subunit [candidate division KSB1 bacterium]|nr:MAG: xanthine dehydrogenase small subunit [candidate division KSB1 bacterium]
MCTVSFYLNRVRIEDDIPSDMTLLEYLRERQGLTGTKEVCKEGDCGACTIALGEYRDGKVQYHAVNSCLLPAARANGKHVVTIEGLANPDKLHPLQSALVEHHGTQCGYCSPGVLMSLFCLFLDNPTPSSEEIFTALEGTLCRCTGYAPILKAGLAVADNIRKKLATTQDDLRPSYFPEIAAGLSFVAQNSEAGSPLSTADFSLPHYHAPCDVSGLFDALDSIPNASHIRYAHGATDVMVDVHINGYRFDHFVDLSAISDLRVLAMRDNHLIIGAGTTLTDLLKSDLVKLHFPALHSAIVQMASTQIRNVATLAGNICTASPIADGIPPLMAYQADVILRSRSGERRLPLEQFITGYRKTALAEREILYSIELPLSSCLSRFEKTGKRRALDIAAVNSAIAVWMDGKRISRVRFVIGGVAAQPYFAHQTCDYLRDKTPSVQVVSHATKLVREEITPISDVRGGADFRRLLARNHLVKHFSELFPQLGLSLLEL